MDAKTLNCFDCIVPFKNVGPEFVQEDGCCNARQEEYIPSRPPDLHRGLQDGTQAELDIAWRELQDRVQTELDIALHTLASSFERVSTILADQGMRARKTRPFSGFGGCRSPRWRSGGFSPRKSNVDFPPQSRYSQVVSEPDGFDYPHVNDMDGVGLDMVRNSRDSKSTRPSSGSQSVYHLTGVTSCMYKRRPGALVSEALKRSSSDVEGCDQSAGVLPIPRTMERKLTDFVVCSLIVADLLLVGYQAEMVSQGESVLGVWSLAIDIFFTGAFSVEILLRIASEKMQFVCGSQRLTNLFDAMVVGFMMAETLVKLVAASELAVNSVSVLRTCRLFRLFRALRVFRVSVVFFELRILLTALLNSGTMIMWIFIASAMMAYAVGISLTEAAAPYCAGRSWDEPGFNSRYLCDHFGNMGRSMSTLYQALFSGILWGELYAALEPTGPMHQIVFMLFMTFVVVVVSNIFAAMVFAITTHVQKGDHVGSVEMEIRNKAADLKLLRDIFAEIDINMSGDVSIDELEVAINNPRIEAMLTGLKVEIPDIKMLFVMLDDERSGRVNLEKFVIGLQRLKGYATTFDIVALQQQTHEMIQRFDQIYSVQLQPSPFQQEDSTSSVTPTLSPVKASRSDGTTVGTEISVHPGRRKPKFPNPGCIRKTELRAMTLAEFRDLQRLVCAEKRHWTNSATGEPLESDPDLYQVCYNMVDPCTAPDGVILKGIQARTYETGQCVIQKTPTRTLAQGVVKTGCAGADVLIEVHRGRFQSGGYPVHIGDFGSCGVPCEVAPISSYSYKELVSLKATRPKWYCSHSWGESVLTFIALCERHAELRGLSVETATYWVCGYANRQHSLCEEIQTDPLHSSFYKAMRLSEGILLHIDEKGVVFTRIWCSFEIFVGVTNRNVLFDIMTLSNDEPRLLAGGRLPGESVHAQAVREGAFPIELFKLGLAVCLEKGHSSVPEDKQTILEYIGDSVDDANNSLHAMFARAAWPGALRKGMVDDFDLANPGTVALPKVLHNHEKLERLVLNFPQMIEVTTDAMVSLGMGLPAGLKDLSLSFEGCLEVTDTGILALGNFFPRNLQSLYLDFIGCKQITDTGIRNLVQTFPPTLTDLTLHFDNCPLVGLDGVRFLAERMPKSVQAFCGTFRSTGVDYACNSLRELSAQVHGSWWNSFFVSP